MENGEGKGEDGGAWKRWEEGGTGHGKGGGGGYGFEIFFIDIFSEN